MSMNAPASRSDEWPRSGLYADGPDWDKGVDCSVEPSLTKQSFADECDINKIMERYGWNNLPQGSRMYEFGEAISPYSFQESMDAVIHAEADFAALPAKVRDRFGNDPLQMLRFLELEENREEAEKLGLLKERAPDPEPLEVRVVNPEPPVPKPV